MYFNKKSHKARFLTHYCVKSPYFKEILPCGVVGEVTGHFLFAYNYIELNLGDDLLNSVKFFLGANTPDGFYSLFNELYNPYSEWQIYIIKGGPGTGKSTIMKEVANEAEKRGCHVERIPCSSDPMSLDGVIIPDLKISVADGTSPHTIEPVFPGVCEHIVDLGQCWDKNILKTNISKIKMISMTNSAAHKKCIKYMKAAKLMDNELKKYTDNSIDHDKINRYSKRFSDTYFNINNNKTTFTTKNRFISALTPIGITLMDETIGQYCNKTIIIKDSCNISTYVIEKIIEEAISNKIDMIICRCPTDPLNKIEHVIFPELKIGVFTSNSYHPVKGDKTVSSSRFINRNIVTKNKNSIAFMKKAKNEMIKEAVEALKSAKSAHDILESYYIEAMNFEKVNEIKNKLISEIFD